MISPGDFGFNLNLSTDQSKKISLFTGTYHDFGDANSLRYDAYWFGGVIKPMNALSISAENEYFIQNNKHGLSLLFASLDS